MSIPIRTRLYPRQGASGIIQKLKKQIKDAGAESSLFSRASSALQNTPFGQFSNSVTNSNFLENMANQGISTIGDAVDNTIGDTLGSAGGSLGGIVGGELGALASDKLSSFLQGALGNNKNDWYQGPAYVLAATNGLTFPTTPVISVSHAAAYEEYDLVHTNYSSLAYKNSKIDAITVTGKFPINSRQEADYFLGALHFLRSITKSHFGQQDENKGVPPPVMMFDAMGPLAFQEVPVVVTNFSNTFEDTYDYVVSSSGTYVPTLTTLTLTLMVYEDPVRVADEFSLQEFRKGNLLNRGYI